MLKILLALLNNIGQLDFAILYGTTSGALVVKKEEAI
jgi:hypothetical protein